MRSSEALRLRKLLISGSLVIFCGTTFLAGAESPDVLEKQCRSGSGEACYQLATWNGQHRNRVKAAEFYAAACDANHAKGCFEAGYLLTFGIAVQRNLEAGTARLTKACDLGMGDGCWQLGVAYEYGRGIPRDAARAVETFGKACDRDSARGCSAIAHLYAIGYGVPEDLSRAETYYKKACDGHDSSACTAVQLIAGMPAAVTAEKDPGAKCSEVVKVLRPYVTMVATTLTRANKPVYDALGRCAWRSGHWETVRIVGEREAERRTGDAAALPYALVKLHKYSEAEAAIKREESIYPDNPRLAWVRGVLQNLEGDFAAAIESESAALRFLDAKNATATGPTGRDALAARARSFACLGRFDDAERDIESLKTLPDAQIAVNAMTEMVFRAKNDRIVMQRVVQNPVPLGTYHLFGGKDAAGGSLVRLDLINLDPNPRQFRIEVAIDGVTERSVVDVSAATGARKTLFFSPPLAAGFRVDSIAAPRQAQLTVQVIEIANGSERVLRQSAGPVMLEPRDYLPLGKRLEENSFETTPEFIAAWVTPNVPGIESLLTAAKRRVSSRKFEGEYGPTEDQVRALWEELKSRGVTYVMDPQIQSDANFYQRTRLPESVLQSTNAQCLEGSILFASLLEAIGLKPMIVLVPGHAYVGWKSTQQDGVNGQPIFIETTWIHDHSFDDAVYHATLDFYDRSARGEFAASRRDCSILDIRELRSKGYSPQPIVR